MEDLHMQKLKRKRYDPLMGWSRCPKVVYSDNCVYVPPKTPRTCNPKKQERNEE